MASRVLLAGGVFAMVAGASQAQLYTDNMESGAGWGINASSGDSAATFGYDYSADDIPEAPNSQGGDVATTGVKLEANLTAGALDVFTLYPIGQSFSGAYTLSFDAWVNYDVDERINGGSAGTTEFLGGRLGYDNASADLDGTSAQFVATNDGGSGSDWRVFNPAFVPPADMPAGDRNGFNAYYSDFLPGVAPPAGQAQLDFPPGTAGSPGFQWVTYHLSVDSDNVVTLIVEKPDHSRLLIDEFDTDNTGAVTDGNIGLVYADFFSSVTSRPDLTFGIIDNVVVSEYVPEPGSLALLGLGGIALLKRRRSA